MLVNDKESPQGLSRYNSDSSTRISFTYKKSRNYLDHEGGFSKQWIPGSPWIGHEGWHLLGPIELVIWSKE